MDPRVLSRQNPTPQTYNNELFIFPGVFKVVSKEECGLWLGRSLIAFKRVRHLCAQVVEVYKWTSVYSVCIRFTQSTVKTEDFAPKESCSFLAPLTNDSSQVSFKLHGTDAVLFFFFAQTLAHFQGHIVLLFGVAYDRHVRSTSISALLLWVFSWFLVLL